MSTLIIRKKSLKTWLHIDSVIGQFIISKFYFNADDNRFQVVEQGQSKRVIYEVSDITLYDDTVSGGAETFANITALSLRLEELNYPAFQYDGQIVSIANLIQQGTNVTITGDGTEASPYVINSSGGGAVDSVNSQTGVVYIDLQSVLTEGDRPIKVLTDFAPYDFILGDETKFLQDDDGEDKTIPPDIFPIGAVLKVFANVGTINILEGLGVDIYGGGTPSNQVLNIGELAIITQFQNNGWFFNKIGHSASTLPQTTSFTAQNDLEYTANGTLTVTDPTPVTNKGYIVHVIGGTVTIGGVGYTSGALVYRYYDGSSWISTNMNTAIDATPTDGSSNAVSSNGVFDALALKADKNRVEQILRSKNNGTYGSHTGNTSETVIQNINIAAGDFAIGDWMNLMFDFTKVGTAGTATFRLRAGTLGTTGDAVIATALLTATTLDYGIARERMQFNTGNILRGINNTFTSSAFDIASSTAAKTDTSLNPSNAWILTLTVQLGNSGDTASCEGYTISKISSF